MGKEWGRAMERAMNDACEKSVRVGESVEEIVEDRLESWEDRLEDLREVVQTLVGDGEWIGNRVSAHGGLLKENLKDINRLRMQGEGASTGEDGAGKPGLLGQGVSLFGLQVDDLNGQTGTVVGWDQAVGRYAVVLKGGREVRVRPVNLWVLSDKPMG